MDQILGRLHDDSCAIRVQHALVGDEPRGQVAEDNFEPIGVLAFGRRQDRCLRAARLQRVSYRAFYATVGFEPVGGDPAQNWQVLQNGEVTIGLFQGMFEKNILTFNPGWDAEKNTLEEFEDVREIQARLKDAGIELLVETDPDGIGIGHIVLADPDGNQIMFDQHVPTEAVVD